MAIVVWVHFKLIVLIHGVTPNHVPLKFMCLIKISNRIRHVCFNFFLWRLACHCYPLYTTLTMHIIRVGLQSYTWGPQKPLIGPYFWTQDWIQAWRFLPCTRSILLNGDCQGLTRNWCPIGGSLFVWHLGSWPQCNIIGHTSCEPWNSLYKYYKTTRVVSYILWG